MDTTFRGWSATLAARVRLVLARLVLIFALPLDFHGRVRVVRSMWDPDAQAWCRPRLPLLTNLAGPVQHFKTAILDAWRNKVAADLCGREGFRGGPLLDICGSLQLLNSTHVLEGDKALLRSVSRDTVTRGQTDTLGLWGGGLEEEQEVEEVMVV